MSDILIKKQRTKSIELKKFEALLRRLDVSHPKRHLVDKDYSIKLVGYKGEQSLDYHLSFLPPKEYTLLHNLRFKHNDFYFQMDTVLISPSFILIIESKNISGTLEFDYKNKQLIRKQNDDINVFMDPVQQVKNQQHQLKYWLVNNGYPPIPLESLVVITNQSSLIIIPPGNTEYQNKIIRSISLAEKIDELSKNYNKETLSSREVKRLTNLMLKEDTPYNPDILKTYQIEQKDLLKGVHCPQCFYLPLERKTAKWVCPICLFSSKEAFLSSLLDYSLLVKQTISNKEMGEFLLIESSSIVHKLLKSANFSPSGLSRATKYDLPVY